MYSREIADLVCAQLSTGLSLSRICREMGTPSAAQVNQWVREDIDGFAARYARARADGLDALADEIQQIADTPVEALITEEGPGGEIVKITRKEAIEHRRLQVDARKWLLSKLAPLKYGDRLTHAGDPNAPLTVAVLDLSKPGG